MNVNKQIILIISLPVQQGHSNTMLKQQLFFIEEKNNEYKMSSYLLPNKKG
jgi:hypothetical protein